MAKARLYVMDCGTLWVERGFMWHFGTREDTGKEYEPQPFGIASSMYFIDHPEAKIVFDLGFRKEDFERRPSFPGRKGPRGSTFEQSPEQNPEVQLRKIGVGIDDIDYVVLSHLMSEHAGWLPLFQKKKAQIIVQVRELEYAYSNLNRRSSLTPFHSWMYIREHFDSRDLNLRMIEGDFMLAEDVEIIFTPGHTPGYQMMMLRLEETGTIVLSSCEHRGMYYGVGVNAQAPGIPHAFSYSLGDELRNFRKILDIVRRERGQLFCGHDLEQFQELKRLPDYYA
ncbi:MAG: N-acyl homoserine lactonase family protein [Dehalococcoidia bacterium]